MPAVIPPVDESAMAVMRPAAEVKPPRMARVPVTTAQEPRQAVQALLGDAIPPSRSG